MASLRKRSKSPYYVACYYDASGQRTQRSTGSTKRAEAMRIALELEQAAREGRAGTFTVDRARRVLNEILGATGQGIDKESVSAFGKRWLATKLSTRAKGTSKTYCPMIQGFLAALGKKADASISAISPADVEAHRDALANTGRKPSTIRQHLKVIGAMFAGAQRQGLIQTNPVKSVEIDDVKQETREPFTHKELAALVSEAKGDWKTAILLGAFAGLRIGDVMALRWDSIDLAGSTITFTPQKTSRMGRTLTLPLHPSLMEHLMNIAGDDAHGFLCPSLAGKSSGSRQFLALMAQAGVDSLPRAKARGKGRAQSAKTFHSLRHYFNSALLSAGVDERLRMALSAHTSTQVNRKYSHAADTSLRDAVAKLPAL